MVAAGLALTCQASAAPAASFTVNPTQVYLSGATRSALLTLKNETGESIRFQLSMMSWNQAPDGQMLLEPTEDIVFFPTLLTLGPGEERKVRVGLATTTGPIEKTYRIFVEELPPLETAKAVGGVTMRTKMGIPIFVQPAKIGGQAQLQDVSVAGDRVSFRLLNTGTVHFTPDAVRVRALDGAAVSIADRAADAWYVLAGGRRDFEVHLPAARCAEVRSLAIEVHVLGRTLSETVRTPNGACAKD